jgi:hypothetical protein
MAGAAGSGTGGVGGDASTDAVVDGPYDGPLDVNPDAIVTVPGLQGFWRFEEAAGPVFDVSGNFLNGTVQGSGVTRGFAGKSGNAISFSGGDGAVKVPGNAKLNFSSAATIEFWIKLSTAGTTATILSRGTGVNDAHVRVRTTQGNVNVSFGTGGSAASLTSGTGVLSTGGSWTHVAITNNGSSLKLFINGKPNQTATGGGMTALTTDLFIGKGTASGDIAMNGSLDELRWFDVVRTDQEICADAGATWGTVDGSAACL